MLDSRGLTQAQRPRESLVPRQLHHQVSVVYAAKVLHCWLEADLLSCCPFVPPPSRSSDPPICAPARSTNLDLICSPPYANPLSTTDAHRSQSVRFYSITAQVLRLEVDREAGGLLGGRGGTAAGFSEPARTPARGGHGRWPGGGMPSTRGGNPRRFAVPLLTVAGWRRDGLGDRCGGERAGRPSTREPGPLLPLDSRRASQLVQEEVHVWRRKCCRLDGPDAGDTRAWPC